MGGNTATPVRYVHDHRFHAVSTARDFAGSCDLERTHETIITAPGRVKKDEIFTLSIQIRLSAAHPDAAGHFIEWIELYFGSSFLFRINLSGSSRQPNITIPVKLAHAHGPLKVWHKCNLHGIGEGIYDIMVEE